jgi:protein-tyrosine-phosphatase
MIRAAAEINVDLSDHVCRWIAAIDLSTADLVIGFEHHHLATAVVDHSARPEISFMFGEIIRLLVDAGITGDGSVAEARAVVQRAHDVRLAQPRYIPTDEVKDPIGRSPLAYREVVGNIRGLCAELARLLFGVNESV